MSFILPVVNLYLTNIDIFNMKNVLQVTGTLGAV